MREIQYWLSDEQLESIYTSAYWNDIDEEKKKEWWIEDGNYENCIKFLHSSKLLDEYEESQKFIGNMGRQSLRIADLAAGMGWTSVLLSKLPEVAEVHAVEISKHRLGLLFEHALKMLSGNGDKIFRYLGSFYKLGFQDNSMDVVYMSQAFHHADKPLNLLVECDRVLKSRGRIILVGEHYIGAKRILRRFFSELIKRRKLTFDFYRLFPTDHSDGDHFYKKSDYYFMFSAMGYRVKHVALKNNKVIYIADKAT